MSRLELAARPRRRADLISLALLVVATAMWVLGLAGRAQSDLTDLGFVSLMGPLTVGSLVLLTLGFLHALFRGAPGWMLAAHLGLMLALLHGTPALLYETLRYSWAWKHIGIVDFIQRTDGVDPSISLLPIYHAWPGFFSAATFVADLTGIDVITIATWSPLLFNAANLVALSFLLRSMTGDRRMYWLGLWLFAVGNWVGQDYFSPQAMGFLLFLVTIGLVLRTCRVRLPAGGLLAPEPVRHAVGLPAIALLSLAIISSHQVTPYMLTTAVIALWAFRVVRGWWLPAGIGGMNLLWIGTVGWGYVQPELQSLREDLFRPVANAEESLEKASSSLPEQVLVSWAGRSVILLMGLLALIGTVRLWRRRQLDRSTLILAGVPATLPVVTSFGGEAVFRVYLFMLPGLVLLAAGALAPPPRVGTPGGAAEPGRLPASEVVARIATAVATLALLAGFLLAHYGKDRVYTFTDAEVQASLWVAESSPPGSLLVEGSRNYPGWFRNYDTFTYVALSREPDAAQEELLADPAAKLETWLSDERFSRSLVLLTRSQGLDVDTFGAMPPGSVEQIEAALRSSPAFEVTFENADAVVFELAADDEGPS